MTQLTGIILMRMWVHSEVFSRVLSRVISVISFMPLLDTLDGQEGDLGAGKEALFGWAWQVMLTK